MGTDVLIATTGEKEIYINLCKQCRSEVGEKGYERLMKKTWVRDKRSLLENSINFCLG